ncbi:MAG: transketolase family protein [Dehalococcoidia bacterium]
MSSYQQAPPHVAALAELGRENPDVVVVSQDLGPVGPFTAEFPERHFDVGISEQNLIGVAAGLAHAGKLPFVIAMAPFVTMRGFEQIRDDCAYNQNGVKILSLFTGLEAGPWGVTHHAIEDIALMRTIPGMTVLVPADALEMGQAVRVAAEVDGPVYVRLAGFAADMSPLDVTRPEIRPGEAARLRDGTDVTLVATGTMVRVALAAEQSLAEDGVSARVLAVPSVKPIDDEEIRQAVSETGRILTIEEHSVIGGLGSAVAEIVAEAGMGRVRRLGVQDRFCTEIAPYADLLSACGLDAEGVEAAARDLLAGS